MAFSGIPLPKVVRDIGEGGPVVDAMLGANALTKSNLDLAHQRLINQYYVPNIQSEINKRNSETKGLDITNQYLPDKLKQANELARLTNQYYAQDKQSEINSRNALTNRTNQMTPYEIQEAQNKIDEYKRSKAIQQQIQDAMSGVGGYPMPAIPNAQTNSQNPYPYTSINSSGLQNVTGNSQEKIVSQGSPNLSKIDNLYDNNPQARAYLEKNGFKKTQQIKVDKSGNPTIVTKYPSGKITVQSQNNIGDEGIPLTSKMISQHQNVVSSVDVAVPVLDKIINMKDSEYSRFGGYTNKGARYNATVKQALDSILGAFGLPQTNEGIKTIQDQLEIGHNESPKAYRERIKELKQDILKRQKYSAGLIKKSIKITGNENENDPYNLDTYDLSGE
jgi:hypothetical protein